MLCDLQCTTDGMILSFKQKYYCSKVQPGKMQPFVWQPFLPAFLFFQFIRENIIVDSHQTLIQYFCTNVFCLFVCPIINLSKKGKN